MTTHKKMPAAGDGYFESYDYGQTWKRSVAGLDDYDYLFGIAVDSGDPKTVVVSASSWPYKAYSLKDAESLVYRKTTSSQDSDHDKEWKLVSKGLPEPHGTLIS